MSPKRRLPVGSYTAKQVQALTGVSYWQLVDWAAMGILAPRAGQSQGTGRWKQYDRIDVLRVRVALELRRAGLSREAMRPALLALRGLEPGTRKAGLFLVVRSGESAAIVSGREMLATLQRAPQGVLVFSLSALLEELSGNDAA